MWEQLAVFECGLTVNVNMYRQLKPSCCCWLTSCIWSSWGNFRNVFSIFLWQALGFEKFSLLGWSDGGITALIAAAMYPQLIRKTVVWGANAFVSEQDLQLYDGDCNQITLLTKRPRCVSLTGVTEHNVSPLTWTAVRDVANWSPRMKEPMEKMYGAEAFAKMWEAWVDGISQFAKRSKGSEVALFQIHDTKMRFSVLYPEHPDQTWETQGLHNLFLLPLLLRNVRRIVENIT